jgi:hypothetical protein
MPTTLRNTDILFNDGTTQSTAAATAASAVGTVGTYALAGLNSGSIATGGTVAGSSLQFANINPTISGALSGTWRCMGFTDSFNLASRITLWLRIS